MACCSARPSPISIRKTIDNLKFRNHHSIRICYKPEESMKLTQSSPTRRSLILAGAGSLLAFGSDSAKKRIAAVVTEYRPRSHADVICSRIFDGYTPNGVRVEPRTRIVSMYTDQIAPKDMSRDMAARHGFPIYPTVAE